MGRHSAPGGEEEDEVLASVPTRDHGTHSDLQLLRENPALRARCIAAAVVPFLLYSVLLIAVGHAGLFLLWVWIPIITAGVLVGVFLDLGYRNIDRHPP